MFDENNNNQTPENGEYRYIPPKEPEEIFSNDPQEPAKPETYAQPQQFIPTPPPVKEKKKRKTGLDGGTIALLLCFSLISGGLGGIITYYANNAFSSPSASTSTNDTTLLEGERENVVIDITKVDTSKQMTPAEVYAANVNSTVGITTSITTNFWGQQTTSAASGSGFIISNDGYVLTNYHVIEGASTITVSFYDGSSAKAKLVGYESSCDIAILKVEASNLTPVILGDSDNMNVGDSVLAIGNPLGELTFTLTTGVISALNRDVTTSNGTTMSLTQTDCAINSGNSGGALFNLYGEVIGITNAKYSSSSSSEASIDNIGFAIPTNLVKRIVESIIEKGYYSKPYIGVSVTDVSAETQSYGLPKGAAVKTVTEGGPAASAGLQINDIITKIGETEISGSNDLVRLIGKANVGDKLKLTVYRMGAYIELELTVGEQKQEMTNNNNNNGNSGSQGINPFR